MREIRFVPAMPGGCPAYGSFYIQDRLMDGRDIYGHETYQYALFRKVPFQVLRRFRTRKQAYEYLTCLTGLTRLDVEWGSHSIIVNDREHLGILHGDTMYRMDKRTREIVTRPLEDEQLTGWYDRYTECLSEAKSIVKRLEEES